MNAAERFVAASHAHDAARGGGLATDVVMLNPASEEPVVSRESVAGALRTVTSACDHFRHTHVLVDSSNGAKSQFGLAFEV